MVLASLKIELLVFAAVLAAAYVIRARDGALCHAGVCSLDDWLTPLMQVPIASK
jgi:hypothetical protein